MEEERGREEWRIPALEDMWFEAPVSRNHSEALGGGVATPAELSAVYSAWLFQTAPGDGGGSCGRWWAVIACWGWNGGRGPRTPEPGARIGMDQAWTSPVHGL